MSSPAMPTTHMCHDCAAHIVEEDDPECRVYVGDYKRLHAEEFVCSVCRLIREEEQQIMEEMASRAEHEFQSQMEQQQ